MATYRGPLTARTPELAGYQFSRELGRGATGRVYLAQQVSLGRLVAIKQLRGASQGGSTAVERFRREGRALARMAHQNIVAVYDLAADADDMFLVLEYVDGPTLGQVIRGGGLSPAPALGVIKQVAAALEYASGLKIIHRDLKPENVLLATDGTCKVADFGLAKLLAAQSSFSTQVGAVMGTPAYMSPEQALGAGDVDERTDVYSLGVVAYELLVGRLPFSVELGEVEILEAHLKAPVPDPAMVLPGFPRKVATVLMKALEKEPRRRFQSARAFWSELDRVATRAWPGWESEADIAAVVAMTSPPVSVEGIDPVASHGLATTDIGNPLATMVDPDAGNMGATRLSSPRAVHPTMVLETHVVGIPGSLETQVDAPISALETRVEAPIGALETHVEGDQPEPAGPMRSTIDRGADFLEASATATRANAAARHSLPTIERARLALPRHQGAAVGSRPRRRVPIFVAIGVLAVLAVGGYLAYRTLVSRGATAGAGPAAPTQLAVTDVTAGLDASAPAVGHCPGATFAFVGHIHGNGGAGRVVYQWTSPDGTVGPETTVDLKGNEAELQARLDFSYSGRRPAVGAAVLKVLRPSALAAAPVQVEYRCP